MSIPQQVKISDLKPIDITINNDQFDKLIATQLKTYDVLNVQYLTIKFNLRKFTLRLIYLVI